MKFDWKHIFEGWRNHLIPPEDLKQMIQDTHIERMSICNGCQWNSKNAKKRGPARCMECGCPLVAKTKCLSCYCELEFPKWEAVLTEEQEEVLNSNDDTG
jgi:hypothetical protein